MFEIITTILFIIFVSVALIVFFRMRKTITNYQKENMHLRRRLDESENKLEESENKLEEIRTFKFKTFDLEVPHLFDHYDFEEYKAFIVLPLDYFDKDEEEIEIATKRRLAFEIAENLLRKDKISFVREDDLLNCYTTYTAILRATIFK